jgi:hypothetical protein
MAKLPYLFLLKGIFMYSIKTTNAKTLTIKDVLIDSNGVCIDGDGDSFNIDDLLKTVFEDNAFSLTAKVQIDKKVEE